MYIRIKHLFGEGPILPRASNNLGAPLTTVHWFDGEYIFMYKCRYHTVLGLVSENMSEVEMMVKLLRETTGELFKLVRLLESSEVTF